MRTNQRGEGLRWIRAKMCVVSRTFNRCSIIIWSLKLKEWELLSVQKSNITTQLTVFRRSGVVNRPVKRSKLNQHCSGIFISNFTSAVEYKFSEIIPRYNNSSLFNFCTCQSNRRRKLAVDLFNQVNLSSHIEALIISTAFCCTSNSQDTQRIARQINW